MHTTPQLGLPYLMPAQAQKHITHNEALRLLDGLTHISVKSTLLSVPPENPMPGEGYIISETASGLWEGKENSLAYWQNGAWDIHIPQIGWIAYNEAKEEFIYYDGSQWIPLPSPSQASKIGINTPADDINRFAIASEASLFTYDMQGGHQVKINKNMSSNFASLVFQTGFSGRAEFGLTGSDDFSIKVSPDGLTWVEALKIDRLTGETLLPATPARRLVKENIDIYVRPDGVDTQAGIMNTPEAAFATPQRAIDKACSLDLGIYSANIHIADGIYTDPILFKPFLGSAAINLIRNIDNPQNVIIDTVETAIQGIGEIGQYHVEAMTLHSPKNCIFMNQGARCTFDNIIFKGTGTHLYARAGGSIELTGNASYAISGTDFTRHIYANLSGSSILLFGGTISCPSLSTQMAGEFVRAYRCSMVNIGGITYLNASTLSGTKYICAENAVLATGGSTTSIPGDLSGVATEGGVVT